MEVIKKTIDIEFEKEELEPLIKAFSTINILEDEMWKIINEESQKGELTEESEETLNDIYSQLFSAREALCNLLYMIDPHFDRKMN